MYDRLAPRVRAGHVRRFTGNGYIKDLASGDVLACQAYSGDVIQLQTDNPLFVSSYPRQAPSCGPSRSGSPTAPPTSATPNASSTTTTSPRSPRALAAGVNYVCPVPAARDVLGAAKDKETAALAEDPLIFLEDAM